MFGEISSVKIFDTNLALHHYFRAFKLNMLKQLSPRHVLKIFMVAYIAPELRALIHSMLLQLSHGFPDDGFTAVSLVALVRKFAEINAILQNFIDLS